MQKQADRRRKRVLIVLSFIMLFEWAAAYFADNYKFVVLFSVLAFASAVSLIMIKDLLPSPSEAVRLKLWLIPCVVANMWLFIADRAFLLKPLFINVPNLYFSAVMDLSLAALCMFASFPLFAIKKFSNGFGWSMAVSGVGGMLLVAAYLLRGNDVYTVVWLGVIMLYFGTLAGTVFTVEELISS